MNNETMMLLDKHFDVAFAAPDGIKKLRELILTLAMQGKLVPQDPSDQPASELLKAIELEKQRLVKEGQIKQSLLSQNIEQKEIPYELPLTWKWCRWNDVALKIGDIDHKMPLEVDSGVPYVSPRDFFGKNEIDFKRAKKISNEDFEMLRLKIQPEKFDIIFPRYGTLGVNRFVLVDMDFLASYSCAIIKNLAGFIAPTYSYFYSISPLVRAEIERYTKKTTQANVGVKSIQIFLYPLPPLAEQHRIVAEIDRLMARCDELEKLRVDRSQKLLTVHTAALNALLKAKDSSDFSTTWSFITQNFSELYSVKENVAELRKAILQLAVMGKLVPQDPNDELSSVLVARIKAERSLSKEKVKKDPIFQASNIPFQIPSSWTWQRVTDLYEVAGGIQKTPQRTPISNFFPYLRVANVQRGRLDLNQIEYFELFDNELDKRGLRSGDLLVVEGNGSDKEIGRCAVWNGEIENCVHQNHIIRVRPIGHNGQPFTLVFFNSPCGMAEMKSLAITTSGLYSLSVGKIREILIPFPPLAEQHRIVAEIDRLMGMCDRLEESIEAAKGKQTDLLNALMSQV